MWLGGEVISGRKSSLLVRAPARGQCSRLTSKNTVFPRDLCNGTAVTPTQSKGGTQAKGITRPVRAGLGSVQDPFCKTEIPSLCNSGVHEKLHSASPKASHSAPWRRRPKESVFVLCHHSGCCSKTSSWHFLLKRKLQFTSVLPSFTIPAVERSAFTVLLFLL